MHGRPARKAPSQLRYGDLSLLGCPCFDDEDGHIGDASYCVDGKCRDKDDQTAAQRQGEPEFVVASGDASRMIVWQG